MTIEDPTSFSLKEMVRQILKDVGEVKAALNLHLIESANEAARLTDLEERMDRQALTTRWVIGVCVTAILGALSMVLPAFFDLR